MRKPARVTGYRTGKRLFVVLCAVVFSCCTSQKQANPNSKPSLNSVPIQISASDLGKAYEDNIVSADYKYSGKLLAVSGPVLGITRESDSIHVHLDMSPYYSHVTCIFSNDRLPELLPLKKGEQATVKGICDGREGGSEPNPLACLLHKLTHPIALVVRRIVKLTARH